MTADGKPPKRFQSQTERDTSGLAARKERERVADVATPLEIAEEVTGNHQGEDLQRLRSLRPTDLRFAHIEGRVDDVVNELGEVRADFGKLDGAVVAMRGEMNGALGAVRGEFSAGMAGVTASIGSLAGEVKGLATVVTDQGKRQHTTFTATVDVDTAAKKSAIEVGAAVQKDEIDAKKERRGRVTKIIGGAIAILTSGAFLGWLLGTHT